MLDIQYIILPAGELAAVYVGYPVGEGGEAVYYADGDAEQGANEEDEAEEEGDDVPDIVEEGVALKQIRE